MRIIETKDIPVDSIVKSTFQSRFDKEKLEQHGIKKEKIEEIEKCRNERIEGMVRSFNMSGLLNSVIVREKDGKNQLIAGDLRVRALQKAGKKEISAKIVEATDSEARVISVVENYHREGLLDIEKEEGIYNLWKEDREELFGNKITIMSDVTGIQYDKLKVHISAGKERDKEKEKKEVEQSKAIINASAYDLQATRQLEKIDPNARRELLNARVNNNISQKDLKLVVNTIKTVAKDVPKDIVKGMANIVAEKKLNPKKIEEFAKTIVNAPPDIQKKMINKIGTRDIANDNKVKHDEVKDKNVINANKAKVKIDFDLRKERDTVQKEVKSVGKEKTRDEKFEGVFIEKYQYLVEMTTSVLGVYHPRKMKTRDGRKSVIGLIEELFKLYEHVLMEIADIKDMEVVKRT